MSRTRQPARLHGLLVIDKPAGWTSHDVVAKIRRLTGERRVGHAGTLDPMATGVLPVAVGDATRVIEYLADADKTYEADIAFGVETDSYDADGRVTRVSDSNAITENAIHQALDQFRGEIVQVPPMHAAIRVGGVRLYELARQGIEIEREPRRLSVYELDLLRWSPPVVTLRIRCSKGFYVRSLAHDLGQALSVGAHLENLVRTSTGPFTLCDAWRMAELAQLDRDGLAAQWPTVALHPDAMLTGMDALVLDESARTRWRQGQPIAATAPSTGAVSVYADDGTWLGIGEASSDRQHWKPRKVIGVGAPIGLDRSEA